MEHKTAVLALMQVNGRLRRARPRGRQ